MTIFGNVQIPRKAAIFSFVLIILIGLFLLLLETFNMSPPLLPGYPGDAFYPRLVICFTAVWCGVILLRGWNDKTGTRRSTGSDGYLNLHIGEFLTVTLSVLAYAVLLKPIGFEIATFFFLTTLLYPRMRYSVTTSVLTSAGLACTTILILWVVFGLGLKVQLPLTFLPLYFY